MRFFCAVVFVLITAILIQAQPAQADQVAEAKSDLAQLTKWRKDDDASSVSEKKFVTDVQKWAAAVSDPNTGEAQLKRISNQTSPSDIERRLFGITPKRNRSCTSDCYVELARNDEASCGPWDWLPIAGCHTYPNIVFAACLGDCLLD